MNEIHIEHLPCKACGGTGSKRVVDPLDLKLYRESHGVGLDRFAKSVRRPEGGVGCSPGFIAKVESTGPCPDWLLAEYYAIPEREWPAKKPMSEKRKKALTEGRKRYAKARPSHVDEKALKAQKLAYGKLARAWKAQRALEAKGEGDAYTWGDFAQRAGMDIQRARQLAAGRLLPSPEEQATLATMGISL